MLFEKWVKEYFSFGRRDRTGILLLVLLILAVYAAPYLFVKSTAVGPVPGDVLARAIDSLSAQEKKAEKKPEFPTNKGTEPISGALFSFDPNTLPASGWQQLGLSEKTAATILKYRSKGGRFRKAEDLQKIWGLPHGFYERVKSHIAIPEMAHEKTERPVFAPRPERKPLVVQINVADTSAFIALPGIGSKLAGRIIAFREKLGGFYSVLQLREIYGLQDSTFQKIRPYLQEGGTVKKFDLNTVTKEELKAHPYFKWKLANAIVEYRNQHGRFKSLEELKNIAVVDAVTFEKIVHYLSL